MNRRLTLIAGALALGLPYTARAQKQYDTGATDTTIKLGQTMPYSGPISSIGTVGRLHTAFFKMINDQGGINGRKVELVSVDDAYNPAKTVEMTRRLVEQDGVLAMFANVGTPTNAAIYKYLNAKKVPHLLALSGGAKFNDPKNFPWTIAFTPNLSIEGRVFAQQILKTQPNAKIAVLYQNDDFGKDYLAGFKAGLGAKGSMLVAEQSYESSDPTISSQLTALRASGADVFFEATSPKFAAQAIRGVAEMGWKPVHYITYTSSSIKPVLVPAGLDKSVGLISAAYWKDTGDAQLANDPGVRDYLAFMKKYYPEGDATDSLNSIAYAVAQTGVIILKQCGDNLTRENVMRQAASLKDVSLPLLLPGIKLNTSPTDYAPIEAMQLVQFDGQRWVKMGELVNY
jgi:branched-chain amino acid transport system substrate-binding protein